MALHPVEKFISPIPGVKERRLQAAIRIGPPLRATIIGPFLTP